MADWVKGVSMLVALLILVVTHWLAFRAGLRDEGERIGEQIRDAMAAVPEDNLLASVDALEAAIKHPDELDHGKLLALKLKAEQRVEAVETGPLAKARRMGDGDAERRLQRQVARARDLLAKLPPPAPAR
jgi:hypothetical protein